MFLIMTYFTISLINGYDMFERILIEEYIFCLRKLYLPSFHFTEYSFSTTIILLIVKIKVNLYDVDSWTRQEYID